MVRALLLSTVMAFVIGCQGKPCTATTIDAGCPAPTGECVDAGEGGGCDWLDLTCGCCLAPAYECTMLQCESDHDGGLAWQTVRSIAPPECRPGS